jgi:hypothetical protein
VSGSFSSKSKFDPVTNSAAPHRPARSLVAHRQQSFWQIWIPLGFGIAILLGLFFLLILTPGGKGDIPVWRDLSLMFMIIPAAIAGLVFLAIFGGLVYLLTRLLKILPVYTQAGQFYAFKLSSLVKRLADHAVNPILVIRSAWAGLVSIRRRFF